MTFQHQGLVGLAVFSLASVHCGARSELPTGLPDAALTADAAVVVDASPVPETPELIPSVPVSTGTSFVRCASLSASGRYVGWVTGWIDGNAGAERNAAFFLDRSDGIVRRLTNERDLLANGFVRCPVADNGLMAYPLRETQAGAEGVTLRIYDSSSRTTRSYEDGMLRNNPDLSAGGAFLVYTSRASAADFVTVLEDAVTGRVRSVLMPNDLTFYGEMPSVSNDGRFVAYQGNPETNVILHDVEAGRPGLVADSDRSGLGPLPSVDEEARLIAFTSERNDLDPSDTNRVRDAFVYNRIGRRMRRVSVDTAPTDAVQGIVLSASGRCAAWMRGGGENLPRVYAAALDADDNPGNAVRVDVDAGGVALEGNARLWGLDRGCRMALLSQLSSASSGLYLVGLRLPSR